MSQEQTTLEKLRQTPNLRDKIQGILQKRFIYTDKIAHILASAIYSKQNVILYGPGGHGKSEMVEMVMEELGLWSRTDPIKSQTLIQSFGEGLTEDALWGGIDFSKLNSPINPEMVFNVDNSFLNYPVAVFEELFDAPAFCLLPLKHTLQAGFLAKNGRSYPMKTQLIIACTNRNPDDIGDMGETYKALLERFILRQEVVWEQYTSNDYYSLINTHKGFKMSEDHKHVLSQIMASCQDTGHFISPRTAMKSLDVLIGSAKANQRDTVTTDDFTALKDVIGFQSVVNNFEATIASRVAAATAEAHIKNYNKEYADLRLKIDSGTLNKVVEWCIMARKCLNLYNTVSGVVVPDAKFEDKNRLTKVIMASFENARDQAINLTRV